MYIPDISEFPSFSLKKLLSTCFGTVDEELKACILIDLPDLQLMHNLAFLNENAFQVQKYAKKFFLDPLLDGVAEEVGYSCVDFLAFKTTGGSNLDPEDVVTDSTGKVLLQKEVGKQEPVNIARYPNGTYLINVITEDKKTNSYKIIKQ